MPVKDRFLRIGTHLSALAAGWVAVSLFYSGPEPEAPPPARAEVAGTGRRPEAEKEVDAKRNAEVIRVKSLGGVRDEPAKAPEPSAEERAAATNDIPGDLDRELKKIEAEKYYDYGYSVALVTRWLREDPAACSAWLGSFNSRVGWGDPFEAFVRALPSQKALDMMENGWLDGNRKAAIGQMAQFLSQSSAAEMPAVVARLRTDEVETFMTYALIGAKAGDAAVWLQLAGSDESLAGKLADKWIVPPDPARKDPYATVKWPQDAEQVLAAAVGTPVEDYLRQRYHYAEVQGQVNEALARMPSEPSAGAAALEEIYRNNGLAPEAAQQRAMEVISERYKDGLSNWNHEEWAGALQQAMLGTLPMRDAVEQRLAGIDRELPEMFQANSRATALREAMVIDPATVIEVAVDRGMADEGKAATAEALRSPQVPVTIKGEIYQALASHDLWDTGTALAGAKNFAARYFAEDPEAAQRWRRSLPSALATFLEEVMR